MIKIGIIHIGSSTLRLVMTEVDDKGYFKVIDELKTPLKVCYSLDGSPIVCENELGKILSTIRTYESLCLASEAKEIIAIASHSFNQISGNEIISNTLKEEFNLHLKVLTLDEEIHYNYVGLNKSLNLSNSLLVQITGINTNLTWVVDGEIKEWAMVPFGHINLSYKYGLNDRILPLPLEECTSFIDEHLATIPWLKNNYDSVIIVGDVGVAIGKMNYKRKRHPFDNFSNYELYSDELHELYNLLRTRDLKKRKEVPGLESYMSETIVGSLSIINKLFTIISSSKVSVSNHSLRDGFLYAFLEKQYNVHENNLNYSIYGILNSLNCNIQHAEQVYWLTKTLFEELKPLHHLNNSYLNILKTGAMLHDCGISINYQHHHKHSLYIILNSSINELSDRELLLSGAVAASHRFNDYEIPLCQYSSIINKLDMKSVNQIGVLLKISEGLDRTLSSKVKDLKVEITEESVHIKVSSPSNLVVEIAQALRAKPYFKEIYNKELLISKM